METKMSVKLNLTQLKHAMMTTEKGALCIVIPVDANYLYKSEVGNLYLDLIAWPLKTPKKDETHLVKQSLPKEIREAMSKEELQALPILGNLKVWEDASAHGEAPPNTVTSEDIVAGATGLPF